MVHLGKACEDCTQNCVLMHQKQKNPSPVVTRFFKIMIGKDYSSVLYLPPSFARRVQDLVGQETQLEDSSGRQWPVTFSIIDGSLAFQRGWHEFSLDHHLEIGHLLVFSYIKGFHFVVQIYGTSGCERLNVNCGKRKRTNRSMEDKEIVVLDEPFLTLDTNSTGKPSSSTPAASGSELQHCSNLQIVATPPYSDTDFGRLQTISTTICFDDPTYMLNRDAGDNIGEDRTYLYDLSFFEMGKNKSDVDKTSKALGGTIVPNRSQIGKQTEPKAGYIPVAENQEVSINSPSNRVLSGKSPIEPGENSSMSRGMSNVFSVFLNNEKGNEVLGSDKVLPTDIKAPSGGSSKISWQECSVIPEYRDCSVSISGFKDRPGGRTIHFKEELVQMGEVASGLQQKIKGKEPNMELTRAQMPLQAVTDLNRIVKTEPDLHSTLVPSVADSPLLVEVKCQSYLEFPIYLSPIGGKNEGGRRQLVYLRNSAGRLWPVLYTATHFVTAFVDGWRRFCEENNIQPGYLCEFKAENGNWCIYKVSVIPQIKQSVSY